MIEGMCRLNQSTNFYITSISGIAVPGMPHGSPGMETHSHESHSHNYGSFKVVSFSNDGNTKIFDQIQP